MTIKQLLAEAKKAGYIVKKDKATFNGDALYTIEGQVGTFTKNGLMNLLGYVW